MNIADYQYLIIAGVPKAATSSLASYLAKHPRVCGSYIKETCFFLDPDFPTAEKPLRADYSFSVDGMEAYSRYFRHYQDEQQIRLDATPDYIYSPGTSKRIAAALPDVKLVFVFREPISRLVSYYGFMKQRTIVEPDLPFDEYVRLLQGDRDRSRFPFDVLRHGRYAEFLPWWYDVFPRDRILVLFYEEFLKDPRAATQSICKLAGIAPEFYDSFQFAVYNKTYNFRYPQVYGAEVKLRHLLRRLTYKSKIHVHFQRAREAFEERLFEVIRERSPKRTQMSDETRKFLVDYYYGSNQQDIANLEKLIGRPVPWSREPAVQTAR